jgi:hypothetical protein
MKRLSSKLKSQDIQLIIVGDTKGPHEYNLEMATLLTYEDQTKLPYSIVLKLPTAHYARKNIGYLEAIRKGATVIYETDDDNAPLPVWELRTKEVSCIESPKTKWFNVYRVYSDELIWPRGYPLDRIKEEQIDWNMGVSGLTMKSAPIQQGLANLSPDVDSIWRLVLDKEIIFKDGASIFLPPGTWCPFNSQSTWWWSEAFHLMYLPSFCSFRMTDIWRSFIAQRCLWAVGKGIVFHSAEVEQDRNQHNLLHDFRDEIPGFLNNDKIVDLLSNVDLPGDEESQFIAIRLCYEALVKEDIFPEKELQLLDAWISDIKTVLNV